MGSPGRMTHTALFASCVVRYRYQYLRNGLCLRIAILLSSSGRVILRALGCGARGRPACTLLCNCEPLPSFVARAPGAQRHENCENGQLTPVYVSNQSESRRCHAKPYDVFSTALLIIYSGVLCWPAREQSALHIARTKQHGLH